MERLTVIVAVMMSAACSSSTEPTPDAGPAMCKFELIHCPAGYACNIASDVCEPCGDAATCSDGW
jgi:hypothetical protein